MGIASFCVLILMFGRLVLCLNIEEINLFYTRQHREQYSQVQSSVNVRWKGNVVTISSNGIPDHQTGYQVKSLKAQQYTFNIPLQPTLSASPTCLPQGMVGVARNGVPIYNIYTDNCCDSAKADASYLDLCWGRVDASGRYHYTSPPFCLEKLICNVSTFFGVAMDGYPIYGPYDEAGNELTSRDLDECHGRMDRWRNYRYHVTNDFPYIIGCFVGKPLPDYVVNSGDSCLCRELSDRCLPSGQTTIPAPPSLPSPPSLDVPSPTTNSHEIIAGSLFAECCKNASLSTCQFIKNWNAAPAPSWNSKLLVGMLLMQFALSTVGALK